MLVIFFMILGRINVSCSRFMVRMVSCLIHWLMMSQWLLSMNWVAYWVCVMCFFMYNRDMMFMYRNLMYKGFMMGMDWFSMVYWIFMMCFNMRMMNWFSMVNCRVNSFMVNWFYMVTHRSIMDCFMMY